MFFNKGFVDSAKTEVNKSSYQFLETKVLIYLPLIQTVISVQLPRRVIRGYGSLSQTMLSRDDGRKKRIAYCKLFLRDNLKRFCIQETSHREIYQNTKFRPASMFSSKLFISLSNSLLDLSRTLQRLCSMVRPPDNASIE